jgi:hypothetical protein
MSTTTHSADWHDREWWQAESRRCGTDWVTLIDAAERALRNLRIVHVGAPSS